MCEGLDIFVCVNLAGKLVKRDLKASLSEAGNREEVSMNLWQVEYIPEYCRSRPVRADIKIEWDVANACCENTARVAQNDSAWWSKLNKTREKLTR